MHSSARFETTSKRLGLFDGAYLHFGCRVLSGETARRIRLLGKVLLGLSGIVATPLAIGVACAAQGLAQAAVHTPLKQTSIEGQWQGTMHTPGSHDRRVVLMIAKDEKGGFGATLYNLDQSGPPVVGSSVSLEMGAVRFVNDFPGLTYEGKISADGKAINGTVIQAAHSLPLMLERATPETEWAIPAPPMKIEPMAPGEKPDIDVSTVKPTQPGTRIFMLTTRGTDLVIRNFSLMNLMKFAYQVQNRQIIDGPGWMDSDTWDIEAKPDTPGVPSVDQEREILQKLLAERFALKTHEEMREMTAYVLTAGKSGPKMTKSTDAPSPPNFAIGPWGVLHVRNATLGDFTRMLQGDVLDRPVVDQTGLTGKWDFVLRWTPDDTQFPGMPAHPPVVADTDAPSLFTAIPEQLGLKIEAQKIAVPVMVVEHVERPSAN